MSVKMQVEALILPDTNFKKEALLCRKQKYSFIQKPQYSWQN